MTISISRINVTQQLLEENLLDLLRSNSEEKEKEKEKKKSSEGRGEGGKVKEKKRKDCVIDNKRGVKYEKNQDNKRGYSIDKEKNNIVKQHNHDTNKYNKKDDDGISMYNNDEMVDDNPSIQIFKYYYYHVYESSKDAEEKFNNNQNIIEKSQNKGDEKENIENFD